ncbi:MAG: iron export ABC transporter permease subunit FetB [Oscillatoriaceae bacterium SKW80]|nr:iron export ABC transporter permease subunit FetB [Oscillatoriaceae bacterium SKYG93]MCX8122344.1 iron export ABC transporter permease subunit FetB [Oscillatoriaceae bacterium SKW80]MDW8452452.1 iron export ABC transporter permease subunit FetB [Oscillatoriaceae cyanobacterium SKYGB_i_bin93]HIK27731.1 iron export ABC transporter permease subunit FetB [Oscillatoriaceae cyanobacterium M7585_C2015_266]
MSTVEVLEPGELAVALGMMAIALGLSVWQQLGLEGELIIATGRAIAQLTVVGYLLEAAFDKRNPWWGVILVLIIMLTIPAIMARNRISKKIPRLLPVVWAAILVSTALTLIYTNLLVIRPERWYEPQYLISLAGILFGNAMNAAALAGERLVSTVNTSQIEIETHLCLGATPEQALAQYRQDAIRAGFIPTLNQIMLVGVVTLPGTFTGQMLGGVSPLVAASYQLLIIFMLALTTLVTVVIVTHGLCRQFFNQFAQLQKF